MADTASASILYPAFAMFLLTALVLARMAQLRVGGIGRRELSLEYYRTYQEGREPDYLRVVTRNFINLFEVPVLFYVILILTYVTRQSSTWMVLCAWAYVSLRYVHTWIHLGANDVPLRFRVYFASGLVLALMWATLFVQLIRAG